MLLLKKEADIVIKTLQDSSKTNNIVIKRLTSTAKNKPQMAPPVEKVQNIYEVDLLSAMEK